MAVLWPWCVKSWNIFVHSFVLWLHFLELIQFSWHQLSTAVHFTAQKGHRVLIALPPGGGGAVAHERQNIMSRIVATFVGSLAAWLVVTSVAVLDSVEEFFVSAVRLYFLPFRAVLRHAEHLVAHLQPPPPPAAGVEIDLDAGLRVPEGAVPPPGAAPPSATPLPGFLVASVAAPSVAGSSNAVEESSDSSSDDDVVPDLSSCRSGRQEDRP